MILSGDVSQLCKGMNSSFQPTYISGRPCTASPQSSWRPLGDLADMAKVISAENAKVLRRCRGKSKKKVIHLHLSSQTGWTTIQTGLFGPLSSQTGWTTMRKKNNCWPSPLGPLFSFCHDPCQLSTPNHWPPAFARDRLRCPRLGCGRGVRALGSTGGLRGEEVRECLSLLGLAQVC